MKERKKVTYQVFGIKKRVQRVCSPNLHSYFVLLTHDCTSVHSCPSKMNQVVPAERRRGKKAHGLVQLKLVLIIQLDTMLTFLAKNRRKKFLFFQHYEDNYINSAFKKE